MSGWKASPSGDQGAAPAPEVERQVFADGPALIKRRIGALERCRIARGLRGVLRRRDGQSTVEVVGAIPLLLVIVLAAAELLAAGAARVRASSAANAAAMALLQGGDPAAAARAAAPGWTHPRITVRVSGRRARVRLSPPSLVPGLSGLLSTVAEADAGPEAAGRAS